MTRDNEAKLDNRNNLQDLLRLVVCSDLRKNLLITLNKGVQSLGSLRDGLNISSTTALHALKELEKSSLVFKDRDKNYALTNIGRITALKLLDFSDTIEVLYKHERFWLEHDLSGIPQHIMMKIGLLKNSTLVENTSTDIFKVHRTFLDLLKNAKEIRGVSPFFIPEFVSLFKELIIENNTDIHLILTNEVYGKLDKEFLEKICSDNNYKFKLNIIKQNVNIGFTVTDYFLSVGFYLNDGTYDFSKDLICYDKEARDWGLELFDYYIKLSDKVTF
ncbi:MAG: winged helix-turn-helix domain-containing protein [Candidatus Methanoperedens sp.]|nr:winged helix-turn-helix domain-containing protein [Candidatus Methanoperedens sp.]